jgi:GT2 family glycosyltransferase
VSHVSIIIPSLNARTVPGVVDALAVQTCAEAVREILVVGLDEPGVIQSDSRIRFVSTRRPVCAAAARNLGLSLARSDVRVVLDADCFPAVDWLAHLLDRYAQGERVVSGCVMFEPSNYWTLADNLSLFHEFMADQPAGLRPYLPTANLLCERGVLEQVGGMDESFPGAAGEDIDWTIRMRRAGFRLYFEPAACVTHRPPRVTLRDSVRHFWWSGRNMSRVRWQYRDEYKTPGMMRSAFWLVTLSPFVGLLATARLFAGNRHWWRYLHTSPAIWLTKMVWCLGAAQQARLTKTDGKGR